MKVNIPQLEQSYPTSKQIDALDINDSFHLMLNDQSKAIDAINKSKKNILDAINFLISHFSTHKDSRLIYCGAGTSGRIAVQDAVELLPTFGWPKSRIDFMLAGGSKALKKSIENAEDDIEKAKQTFIKKKISYKDVVICIAASGNTSFTNKIMELSFNCNVPTIAISNNPAGIILNKATFEIVLDTKQEVVAGSTRLKAGTAQKICLNIISTILMTKLGNVKNGMMINMVPTNKKLIERMMRIKKFNDKKSI